MTSNPDNLPAVVVPAIGFDPETRRVLADKLDARAVQTRTQAGQTLSYLPAWYIVDRLNDVFGYDGWDRETGVPVLMSSDEYDNPRDGKKMFRVGYMCRVRLTIRAGGLVVSRDGVGFGVAAMSDPAAAHEKASKEAESDATKRAASTLGNQFGNVLRSGDRADVGVPDYVIRSEAAGLTADQLDQLGTLMAATQTEPAAFASHLGVALVSELPAAEFERARGLLLKKRDALRSRRVGA